MQRFALLMPAFSIIQQLVGSEALGQVPMTMPVPSPGTCASDSDLGNLGDADLQHLPIFQLEIDKIREATREHSLQFCNLLQVVASHIA